MLLGGRRWRALGVAGARAASRGARRAVGDALLDVQRQLAALGAENSARAEAKALVASALRPRLESSSDVIFQLDRQVRSACVGSGWWMWSDAWCCWRFR